MKTTKKITINPARLQWCCEAIDVDIDRLANDINIAKTTLEKAEVSIKQLEKIAHYFNRGLLFFLEPNDVVEDKIYSPQFRTINNQTPIHDRKLRALIERVEKQGQIVKKLDTVSTKIKNLANFIILPVEIAQKGY